MNKRHYEHTLPNIRGSLSNTYCGDIKKKRSNSSTIVIGFGITSPYVSKYYQTYR